LILQESFSIPLGVKVILSYKTNREADKTKRERHTKLELDWQLPTTDWQSFTINSPVAIAIATPTATQYYWVTKLWKMPSANKSTSWHRRPVNLSIGKYFL
jgi:hypothetical protein